MPTHRKYFETEGKPVSYNKDQIFVRPEDENPWVYHLAEGLVEISQSLSDGSNRLIGYFFPGATFAQSGSFFQTTGSGLEYMAVVDSRLFRMSRERFFELLSSDGDFNREYIDLILRNQFLLMERIAFMGETNIDRKITKLLIGLASYYGHKEDDVYKVDIPITQETLARFTHSTRESASKTVRRLTRDKVISVDKKVLTILDIDKLRDLLS